MNGISQECVGLKYNAQTMNYVPVRSTVFFFAELLLSNSWNELISDITKPCFMLQFKFTKVTIYVCKKK